MKIAATPLASLRDFYTQLSHFDPMLREELSKNLDDSPIPASANIALSFAEKLMLCPTAEAATTCVQQDVAGAVSFVLAMQGLLQRIEKRRFQFATQSPKYQTPFYLLASAVQEYLDSLQTLSAEGKGGPPLTS
jgi:hypothetical protein